MLLAGKTYSPSIPNGELYWHEGDIFTLNFTVELFDQDDTAVEYNENTAFTLEFYNERRTLVKSFECEPDEHGNISISIDSTTTALFPWGEYKAQFVYEDSERRSTIGIFRVTVADIDFKSKVPYTMNGKISGWVSRGIDTAEVDGNGHLILTMTDGDTVDLGNVKGAQGQDGADGEDGVGIASITFKQTTAAGNVYTVTLTDGTTYEITAPKGAQGEQGAQGDPGEDGKSAYEAALDGGYTGTEQQFNTALAGVQSLAEDVSAIEEKIPSVASSTNKLVSASEMGDAISSVEAKQLYATNAQGSFATKAALLAATTFYNADGTVATPTKNDVTYILADESHSGKSAKYVVASISGGVPTWGFVITFSDTTFTQAQMDAINSGATAEKINSIAEKQGTITASGILKGNGSGGVSAAVAGTDYQTPISFLTDPNEAVYKIDGKYITAEYDSNGKLLAMDSKLGKTGDGSNVTVAFTQASSRANIATGEKLSAIFGKIAKWFADLKTVAFTGSYTDLTNKPSIPSTAEDIGYDFGTGYSNHTIGKGLESLSLNLEGLSSTVSQKYAKPSTGIPKSDLASAVQTSLGLADTAVQPESGKGLFSGSYNDLSNKPTIPTVPTNVSAFNNDAGYLTSHQSLEAYRTASEQDTIDGNKEAKGKITISGVEKTATTHTVTIVTNGVTTTMTLVGVS